MKTRGVAVVVEGNDDTRAVLSGILRQAGFAVHSTATGSDGVEKVRLHNPDIVTMDVGLPDFDGLEASRRIRTFSDAYLIIVSNHTDEADALMGFEAGADDYVLKPFRPRELRARIGAMLRRPRHVHQGSKEQCPTDTGRGGQQSGFPEDADVGPAAPEPEVADAPPAATAECVDFDHKGLTLCEDTRLAAIEGVPVALTRSQFDILLALMENGRTIQTKADLVRRLRNEPYSTGSFAGAGEERAVEVHLSNLRKRLGEDSRNPQWIETVHGIGYRMTI